ncbi:pentapeptide repeat-containing protein [Actinoplanes sp. N902-109]|uniref:pentapeptide repeat-containing protein n=1 Tax=Actinoplanes sp. (strain N902-109) TaxID=649831 RepID=UPI0003294BE8|nr:pentapeptide repeat-containing protein [Actinoplanes sp. N902-109]AGL18397.1 hypothetical protein L083_4887 [Actinoplanes sp. N902-109]
MALGAVAGAGVARHPLLVALGLPALALLSTGAGLRRRRSRDASWPWLLSYPGVLGVAAAVTGLGVAAMLVMLHLAARSPVAERPALQIDAIKYGLGIGAAAGAAAALLLGVRRQQHTEHAQSATELDAAERRVTDLYTKAVEQLGHAEAAVRLGGLYALERVAQNTPDQRQTVVNVLCAYLRMPPGARDPDPESQVRRTAQRILTTHLAGTAGPAFWPGLDLDLAGAALTDLDLRHARVGTARFSSAVFSGDTRLDRTTFTGPARFDGATFDGVARLDNATFADSAVFRGATFGQAAWFGGTTFAKDAAFDATVFRHDAWCYGVTCHGAAWFGGATFEGQTSFEDTHFADAAWLRGARFARPARFRRALFYANASFDQAGFAGGAHFEETTYVGDASFDRATFAVPPSFTGCRIIPRADRADTWPPGWRPATADDQLGTLVADTAAAGRPDDRPG